MLKNLRDFVCEISKYEIYSSRRKARTLYSTHLRSIDYSRVSKRIDHDEPHLHGKIHWQCEECHGKDISRTE